MTICLDVCYEFDIIWTVITRTCVPDMMPNFEHLLIFMKDDGLDGYDWLKMMCETRNEKVQARTCNGQKG